MGAILACVGFIFIVAAVWDGIETLVLARAVERRVRITTLYYGIFWGAVRFIALRLKDRRARHMVLSAYSPLSVVSLIIIWATLIVIGYAMVYSGLGIPFTGDVQPSFNQLLYASGITFFTVGYGDITPISDLGHLIAILEAATGFGFLGVVIGFIPVLYSSFSRREASILLLDAKAGSEPTAYELIRRHAEADAWLELISLLKDWEFQAASLLENCISYPVLAYYRSQHEGQSWLRSLTEVMDACALIESSLDDDCPNAKALRFQARATFAMGRHLVVDLAYLLAVKPDPSRPPRITPSDAAAMRLRLRSLGAPIMACNDSQEKFFATMREYEPFVIALSEEIILDISTWIPEGEKPDNWQVSAWDSVNHF
jgi:hypothetical protein